MTVIASFAPTSSASVELRALIFCLLENPDCSGFQHSTLTLAEKEQKHHTLRHVAQQSHNSSFRTFHRHRSLLWVVNDPQPRLEVGSHHRGVNSDDHVIERHRGAFCTEAATCGSAILPVAAHHVVVEECFFASRRETHDDNVVKVSMLGEGAALLNNENVEPNVSNNSTFFFPVWKMKNWTREQCKGNRRVFSKLQPPRATHGDTCNCDQV